VPLDIAHGIHDGRKGSVPFEHSLRAFNVAVKPERGSIQQTSQATTRRKNCHPGWSPASPVDASYGLKTPLFRATSGNTRVTIFEGGHEIVHQAALNWLAKQRKGQPPVWEVKDFIPISSSAARAGSDRFANPRGACASHS
jgi:hypothetical protein